MISFLFLFQLPSALTKTQRGNKRKVEQKRIEKEVKAGMMVTWATGEEKKEARAPKGLLARPLPAEPYSEEAGELAEPAAKLRKAQSAAMSKALTASAAFATGAGGSLSDQDKEAVQHLIRA